MIKRDALMNPFEVVAKSSKAKAVAASMVCMLEAQQR